MYNFDEILQRENTNSFKNDLTKQFNPNAADDCISMTIADMDFRCAEPILAAMRKRLDNGILGYTQLDDDYYDCLIRWYDKRYSYKLKKENISTSYGVVYAIDALVRLMTAPGEGVMIFTPSYAPFEESVNNAEERKLICIPLINDKQCYSIDFDAFRKAAQKEDTTLLILCSPHNPTGRIWTDDELKCVADICFENGVRIISDEIHSDLTRKSETFTSFAKLTNDDPRVVICSAPSKTFNLAGNWMANIFIFDEKLKQVYDKRFGLLPNPLSMEAAKAAYTQCEEWLEQLRIYLDKTFIIIEDFIKAELPLAVFRRPQATYLAWIDLSAYISDSAQAEDIIARGGVLVEGGHRFVGNALGHVRLNCAMPHTEIREALRRIKCALSN